MGGAKWIVRKFGECATLVRDTVSPADVKSSPYIGLEHIGEGSLSLIGQGTADDVMSVKSHFRRGDVLFGKLRPYFRKVVIAPFDGVCSTDIWVVRPQGDTDAGFLFYWMASDEFVDASVRGSEGTKMPRAQWEFVSRIERPVPPLSQQRAIAHILGTLDDKIELNRRMNETLEAMARAVFKSWFVDFDPVRAKMEGRDPLPAPQSEAARQADGLPPHLADLFPGRFEESELGEIPAGWGVGQFGDIADNPRRGVQPNAIEPSKPYIGLEHMPRRCIALSEWGQAEELESNKFEFKRGDILFGKLRPYFHKVGVAPVVGVCSTDILVVVPKEPEWFGFVIGHISSVEFISHTDAASTGTKMPRTSWQDMARFDIVLPPVKVVSAYTGIIHSLIDRIITNIHESRTLAALRDALLPKLLSGEIRVPEAEKFVAERLP